MKAILGEAIAETVFWLTGKDFPSWVGHGSLPRVRTKEQGAAMLMKESLS
jgi:hypothetical protein